MPNPLSDSKDEIPNHSCKKTTQRKIAEYGIGKDHSFFIQCQFIADAKLSLQTGTSEFMQNLMREIYISATGLHNIMKI